MSLCINNLDDTALSLCSSFFFSSHLSHAAAFFFFLLTPPFFKVLTNGTLIISNLRASDQQQYMCEANSSIGRSVSNATLSLLVIGKAQCYIK